MQTGNGREAGALPASRPSKGRLGVGSRRKLQPTPVSALRSESRPSRGMTLWPPDAGSYGSMITTTSSTVPSAGATYGPARAALTMAA